MNIQNFKFAGSYVGLLIVSIFLSNILLFAGCQDVKGAKETLEINNYRPIEIGGYGWFQGRRDDIYITKFTAISPTGDTVNGVVTSGWFKPSSIIIQTK